MCQNTWQGAAVHMVKALPCAAHDEGHTVQISRKRALRRVLDPAHDKEKLTPSGMTGSASLPCVRRLGHDTRQRVHLCRVSWSCTRQMHSPSPPPPFWLNDTHKHNINNNYNRRQFIYHIYMHMQFIYHNFTHKQFICHNNHHLCNQTSHTFSTSTTSPQMSQVIEIHITSSTNTTPNYSITHCEGGGGDHDELCDGYDQSGKS